MQRKKNAQGAGTIRKRPDGRWEARFTTGFDPNTGKQVQKSIYGKTQKEVREKLTAMTQEVDAGTYIDEARITLSEWLDTWLETYVKYSVKPYTLSTYQRACENYIKPALGSIPLAALSVPKIQQFYNWLLAEKHLNPKTVRNFHGTLHRALNQAVKLGMIRANPAALCDLPKTQRKEFQPLEREDITNFFTALEGHPFQYLYLVTLFTGMRQGEVLGLTWDCVDFDHGVLSVNKQLQKVPKAGGPYLLVPTKNSRSRTVTVAPTVMALLRKQRSRQAELRLAAGPAWNNELNLVFTNELGGHLVHEIVRRHFKEVTASIGRPGVRFHDLRHTYAVVSLESGDDVKTVQSNLGHATAAFTLDIYGHISQRMRQQSAQRMEAFIQTVRKTS